MSTVMDPFPCLSDMFGTSNTTKKVATALDPFPCLSGMFGTYNTTKKVATAGTCDTPSNNEEDGLVHVSKSDKLNDTEMRCACCVRGKANKSWPFIYLGACSDHLNRRIVLGELWDCQLGNLTAGKDSGGGG
ncbi:hypothetical protein Tco_1141755 [Tanacetum coccineum]